MTLTPQGEAVVSSASTAEQVELEVPRERRPRHIAIIMDGNGRWAQRQGLPRIEGHRRGVESVRRATEECARLGIGQLTLYSLSTENWKRPKAETDFLMRLLAQYLIEERRTILRENIRLHLIGRRDRVPADVLAEADKTMELSRDHTGLRLCLAIDYGSRTELVDAARQLAREVAAGRLAPDEIDEARLAGALYTAGMEDPDLLVRTAGDFRVSNFLLWQISYAEIWVTEKSWPEFREPDLHQAIRDFAARDRRFGGLNG